MKRRQLVLDTLMTEKYLEERAQRGRREKFLAVLAKEGASLLLVEQYVTRALAIADYVYLLKRGSVAFAGEPSELDADAIAAEYVGSGH